jgi:hypothetical protein
MKNNNIKYLLYSLLYLLPSQLHSTQRHRRANEAGVTPSDRKIKIKLVTSRHVWCKCHEIENSRLEIV